MPREMIDQLREAINQSSFGTDDVKQARQSVTAEEITTLQRKLAQKRGTTMTNTIEVPVELIESGDMDAIRELLPKPNLFGRWAEHPDYGRGIIISEYPDLGDCVWFARAKDSSSIGEWERRVSLDSLTLDPVELVAEEDFENAPMGTVVADSHTNAFQKTDIHDWESVNDMLTDKQMAASAPWKILRWGWGE